MKIALVLKTSIISVSFLLLLAVFFISCSSNRFDEDWIIGKTYSEIVSKYGEFDICSYPERVVNGMCYGATCGYKTKERITGFLGSSSDEYYMIIFDSEGFAYKVRKNVPRMGG
jgi:hypothetical protein